MSPINALSPWFTVPEAPGQSLSGADHLGANGAVDHMGSRLRIFQKRKQKIPREMKDVKKSDSNPGPHDQ